MKLITSLTLLICLVSAHATKADMFFTIIPTSPSTVVKGGNISFDILVRSDFAIEINGMDMILFAGVGNGTQGTFTTGSTSALAGTRFFDISKPGKASVNWGGTTSSITTSDQVFGSFVINTTNSQFGTFNVSFNKLVPSASSSFGNAIGIPGSYSVVTAVPEPSSLLVCALGALGGAAYYRVRRRKVGERE